MGILPLSIVVPLTSWRPKFAAVPWLIPLNATAVNGLTNDSAIDAFQIKSVSHNRFHRKIGLVSAKTVIEVVAAVNLCINIDP